MPDEPTTKRAVAFFDGQNLYHSAKKAFGYNYPNYDPRALAQHICVAQGWDLRATHFYTGVPDIEDNRHWHEFWTAKLLRMRRQGIAVFSRPLRYRNKSIGGGPPVLVGEEKGIDVRIALDVISLTIRNKLDVALIFSQDQDLSEVANEVREISTIENRWIKVACAFPVSPTSSNKRGINNTDWIKFRKEEYDTCLDTRDYRPSNRHP